MKSKLTFALAASMLTLALAAAPQKAHAASEAYISFDGIQHQDTTPAKPAISFIVSLVSLILLP